MNTVLTKEDAFTVPDSTDWLPTPLASLSSVESALRCQVCKDFYQTPMITSCAHTFCSVCIRRCLSTEGKCPACRTNDQELKLRFNGAMEEVVQAFIQGRDSILEFAQTPKEQVIVEVPVGKRRRGMEDEEEPRKRTRASTRQQSQSSQSQSQKERVIVVDSEDEGDEILPDGIVHCPICNAMVKEDTINAHIDRNCSDPVTPKPRKTTFQPPPPTFSSKPIKPFERLAQVNYSMMKDVPLRKKLTDAGLSAAGSRQLLQQRYSEWITLWNANCDATKPKSKGELKREMDVWERTQGGRAMGSTAGSHIRDKDFDGSAWSTKHDGDFKNLIANARKKIAKAVVAVEEKKDEPAPPEDSLIEVEPARRNGPVFKASSEDQQTEDFVGNHGAPLMPVRENSQKSRYFQDNDVSDDNDLHPPSSQHVKA